MTLRLRNEFMNIYILVSAKAQVILDEHNEAILYKNIAEKSCRTSVYSSSNLQSLKLATINLSTFGDGDFRKCYRDWGRSKGN